MTVILARCLQFKNVFSHLYKEYGGKIKWLEQTGTLKWPHLDLFFSDILSETPHGRQKAAIVPPPPALGGWDCFYFYLSIYWKTDRDFGFSKKHGTERFGFAVLNAVWFQGWTDSSSGCNEHCRCWLSMLHFGPQSRPARTENNLSYTTATTGHYFSCITTFYEIKIVLVFANLS